MRKWLEIDGKNTIKSMLINFVVMQNKELDVLSFQHPWQIQKYGARRISVFLLLNFLLIAFWSLVDGNRK